MKYQNWLSEVRQGIRRAVAMELNDKAVKLARKLYNQRYTAEDAVATLICHI